MFNILSIITGGIIAFMMSLNGVLSDSVGNYTATAIIHFTGLVVLLFMCIINSKKIIFDKNVNLILYTGGIIGIFTVIFNNFSINNIGATLTVSLAVLGQAVSSIFIDHFGIMGVKKIPFNRKKILGVSIMITGIVIMTLY